MIGLTNYNKVKCMYIDYMDATTDRFLDDIDYEIMLLRNVSGYANMYYHTQGKVANLRLHIYLLAPGSGGKGHILKQDAALIEEAKYCLTESNTMINKGTVTDARMRGMMKDVLEPKIDKDGQPILDGNGNPSLKKVNKFVPGMFEKSTNIYFEEAADLFNSGFHGEGRESLILNGCESDTVDPGTGSITANSVDDTSVKETRCNFSGLFVSIPDVKMKESLLIKNVFGRFICLYPDMPNSKDNLYDEAMASLKTTWVMEEQTLLDDRIKEFQTEMSSIFVKSKAMLGKQLGDEPNKSFINFTDDMYIKARDIIASDIEWEELLAGFEKGQSWGEYEAAAGVFHRLRQKTIYVFSVLVCMLNKDTTINEYHLDKANEMTKRTFHHFINYFRDHIAKEVTAGKKSIVTNEDINGLILKVLKNYYLKIYPTNSKKMKKTEFVKTLREESINVASKLLPKDPKNLARRVSVLIKEGSIVEMKGDGNTKYVLPNSIYEKITGKKKK